MTETRKNLEALLEAKVAELKEAASEGIESEPVKVLLPIINNVMGSLLARDIIGVQPMSNPHDKEEWPYQVDALELGVKYVDILNAQRWCRETLPEGEWVSTVQFFAFKTEESATWFKLRWG